MACLDCSGCREEAWRDQHREEITGATNRPPARCQAKSSIRRGEQNPICGFTGGVLSPNRLRQPFDHLAVDWEDWPEESQSARCSSSTSEYLPRPSRSRCLACGGSGCGMCQAKPDPRRTACVSCGGLGCLMCQATATPSSASCLACGGSGCGMCQDNEVGRKKSCLACGRNGCSMCNDGGGPEIAALQTAAAQNASCLACGGNGCSMCRAVHSGCRVDSPPPPQSCVACGGHGCSLCQS